MRERVAYGEELDNLVELVEEKRERERIEERRGSEEALACVEMSYNVYSLV